MNSFDIYIGIDYSGAGLPTASLKNLQVYMAKNGLSTKKIYLNNPKNTNWSRKEVALWLVDRLQQNERCIVGIDHCFSFPCTFMKKHKIKTWDAFLIAFWQKMKTTELSVKQALENHPLFKGNKTDLRVCETWTSSAKPVFEFKPMGVSHSSYAGVPWLKVIRDELSDRVHFWPFDGWDIRNKTHVIAEVYPSIFSKRYVRANRTRDEHDAYSVARWLEEKDKRGFLEQYFHPQLTAEELNTAKLEGWILGIL